MKRVAMVGAVLLFATGCLEPVCDGPCDGDEDGGDLRGDAGVRDGGFFVWRDAGVDAGLEPVIDAGTDAGVAPVLDAGTDAGLDPVIDAGTDAGLDAGCIQPPSGLVGWWRAENDALDSRGPNHGTLTSGTSYTTGVVGRAFLFDGVSGSVTAGTLGFPTGAANRTMELWVRVDRSTPEQQPFVGYGSFGSHGTTYQLGQLGGGSGGFFSQWGEALVTPPLAVGRWTHVAVTSVSQVTTVYVDGVLQAAGYLPLSTSMGSSFVIGRLPLSSGQLSRLQGAIDEVAVYDRALSAADIAALAAAPQGKCR
jgi:hypothetical protein